MRDAFGNALGGIRLPQLDVPIATYGPHNNLDPALPLPPFLESFRGLLNLFCVLAGTVADFDDTTLESLYSSHKSYFRPFMRRTRRLREAGFLLAEDALALKMEAATVASPRKRYQPWG